MSDLTLLDQELVDTIEAHRRKEGMPPLRAPVGDLARDIVGSARAPKAGVCAYCGGRAPGRTVCWAHEDLIDLDAGTSAVVTNATFNGSGREPVRAQAAGATGGDCT